VHYTLGYDYALSRRTTLFVFTSHLRNDARGVYDFAINGLAPDAGTSLGVTAAGIRHSF
jgi:predicted porin